MWLQLHFFSLGLGVRSLTVASDIERRLKWRNAGVQKDMSFGGAVLCQCLMKLSASLLYRTVCRWAVQCVLVVS